MTNDDWFGVTPEPVAKYASSSSPHVENLLTPYSKIAEHLAQIAPPEKTILIDAFGGAGGNTIAFALSKRWKQIFYMEKNPLTLKCARHNAEVYGVKNKIMFLQGDCFDLISKRFQGRAASVVIFASPPWGGVDYKDAEVFDLSTMKPYNLKTLYDAFTKISPDVALYLPRSSNLNQIARQSKGDDELQVMHYCVDGASKVCSISSQPLLCGLLTAALRHCACTMAAFYD
jgi:trimethylguanosine synthase